MSKSDVVFVILEEHTDTASTVIRAKQLSALLAYSRPDISTSIVPLPKGRPNRFWLHNQRIVIFNKWAALKLDAQYLHHIAKKLLVIIDPVDSKISEQWNNLDCGIIASSKRAEAAYIELFPRAMVRHVVHHVNLQIPPVEAQQQTFRLGFFGLPENGFALKHFENLVEVVKTPTNRNATSNWTGMLPDYSIHYGIRQSKPHDGFKPFTKGSVAAHVRVPIITSHGESDAAYYLGNDYPFFAMEVDVEGARNAIAKARNSFRSEVWDMALQRMDALGRQTTPHAAAHQLGSAIDDFRAF